MSVGFRRLVELLHTDFCPDVNRYVYWMKNPIWLLIATLLSCVATGIFVNPALLFVAGGIAAVILLGWGWPWLTMRFLNCELVFSKSRCREGESIVARLTIRNTSWFPAWGLTLSKGFVSEIVSGGDSDAGPIAALGRVASRATSKFVWEFTPTHRGIYPAGQPLLETRFPFGLSCSQAEIDVQGSLVVWPEMAALHATPETLTMNGREDRLSDRRVGDFGDVLGTRSFRDGDSLRRIHWAQSARLDRLIVCERQAACTCRVNLAPDLHESSHASGSRSSLEQTLKITASLLHHFFEAGTGCDLFIGQEKVVVSANDQGSYRRGMDALSRVPVEGFRVAQRYRSHDESDIVITTDLAHQTGPSRVIVLETDSEGCPVCHHERAFCRVPVGTSVKEFPVLWRKACHAA